MHAAGQDRTWRAGQSTPAMTGRPMSRPVRAALPASPLAARHARDTIRRALAAWGMTDLSSDTELLVSELVANAAEHARTPIGLTIRPHVTPAGQRGIACEVTDTSPVLPVRRQPGPDRERGRGLAIVAALATTSGCTTTTRGKTAWFTLTAQHAVPGTGREPERELEAGA